MIAPVLIATRSRDKFREIDRILRPYGVGVVEPAELGLLPNAVEDDLEVYSTFAENALAKARYFFDRSGLVTLADDSGLSVDALDGAPGVRSKRFSERQDVRGASLDRANNDLLLGLLDGVPEPERNARYVCAVALVGPGCEVAIFEGTCEGLILNQARGDGGFGYDPLMYIPEEKATFAELGIDEKNRLSHRGGAFRAAAEYLLARVDGRGFTF